MPRDFVFVSWNFGPKEARRGAQIVRRWRIEAEASYWARSSGGGYGSVRLRREDPRLKVIIRELLDRGAEPNPRFDREFTTRELNAAAYLHLVVATAGLTGSANVPSQSWGRQRACKMCGAGAVPKQPLRIEVSQMGRKLMDATAHDCRLIVASAVASALIRRRLRGFVSRDVCKPAGIGDDRWKWLDVRYEWPPVDRRKFVYCPEPCSVCRRAGHYSAWSRPTAFVYDRIPVNAPDFGNSFEHFGRWYDKVPGDRLNGVAGGRVTIVSQRARQVLIELGVKRMVFEPVLSSDDPLLRDWPDGRLVEELSA